MQVDQRLDLVTDRSPVVDDAEARLRPDLHLLRRVDEHHREPRAVLDVVAAAAPAPPVVAEATRNARHVPGRALTAATTAAGTARMHVARTVGQVAGAARHRDGMDDTGRRHRVDKSRLLSA